MTYSVSNRFSLKDLQNANTNKWINPSMMMWLAFRLLYADWTQCPDTRWTDSHHTCAYMLHSCHGWLLLTLSVCSLSQEGGQYYIPSGTTQTLALFKHFLLSIISLYTSGTTHPLASFNHSPTATIYLHTSGTTHPLVLSGSSLLCTGKQPLEAGHLHAYCSPIPTAHIIWDYLQVKCYC